MSAEVDKAEVERIARDLCRKAGHDCESTVRLQLGADWLPHEIAFMQASSPQTLIVKDGKVIGPPMLLDIPRWREFRPAAYEQMVGRAP